MRLRWSNWLDVLLRARVLHGASKAPHRVFGVLSRFVCGLGKFTEGMSNQTREQAKGLPLGLLTLHPGLLGRIRLTSRMTIAFASGTSRTGMFNQSAMALSLSRDTEKVSPTSSSG